jgi:hypothetical protein
MELDDPPPLQVLGPLEENEFAPSVDRGAGAKSADAAGERPAGAAVTAPKAGGKADADLSPPGREQSSIAKQTVRAGAPRPWDAAPPTGRAQLFVFVDGESAWRDFTPEAACKPGRYAVRIVVDHGAVREARPVGGGASATPSQRLCAADLILGLDIDGVVDGEYPAEVVVEPRGSGR